MNKRGSLLVRVIGLLTGSTVTTTRILQAKPAKQPIVIVSKNSGNQISTENPATVSTTQNSTTPNQVRKNNVCNFVDFEGIFLRVQN